MLVTTYSPEKVGVENIHHKRKRQLATTHAPRTSQFAAVFDEV